MKKFIAALGIFALVVGVTSCCGDSCGTEDKANKGFNDSVSTYFGRVNGFMLSDQVANDPQSARIDKKEFMKAFKTTMLADTANLGQMFGVQVAQYLNHVMKQFDDGADFNRELVVKEFEKAFFADSVADLDHTRHMLDSLINEVQTRAEAKRRADQENDPVAIQNKVSGKAFMDKIKQEADVKTTDSGLAYKVVEEGNGARPEITDRVTVSYKGMLIDETVFDESTSPVEFPVTGVIPGFSEGLQLMPKGSKYIFYIPGDLAYGINAPATIGPNQTLIFEVELVDIKK